jgi:predicted nucleic acid-binding protein
VKAFLDTSVLVATFYAHHQFHQASLALFLRFKKRDACCGAHSLPEIYASLTGRSGRERVSGAEAMLFLGDVRERLTIVSLNDQEYFEALVASSALGIAGGAIYDALLAHCALKAKVQAIYTWNAKDFTRLGADLAGRVKEPAGGPLA